MTTLGPKSGGGRRLRRARSRQKVPWDGGGCDGALEHGPNGATRMSGKGGGSAQQHLNRGEGKWEKQGPRVAWRGRGSGRPTETRQRRAR
jgi:hypothetical protein